MSAPQRLGCSGEQVPEEAQVHHHGCQKLPDRTLRQMLGQRGPHDGMPASEVQVEEAAVSRRMQLGMGCYSLCPTVLAAQGRSLHMQWQGSDQVGLK